MANLEKHKKNPLLEYLEGEDSTVPAQPRSSHVLGAYIKIPKSSVSGKSRPPITPGAAPKIEPALVREPALPSKAEEKHSQATSREHLLKSERLPKLRAPFVSKSVKPAAVKPPARVKVPRRSARMK